MYFYQELQRCKKPLCFKTREFIYPLYNGQKNIGFISVSGYKTDSYKDYLKSVSIKYDISYRKLKNVYVQLEAHFPRKEDIDVLILPLCQMLELALIKTQNENPQDISFPEKVMRYIIQYHAQNITSDDICNYFSCSRSYMSTEFNKYYGKSIRQCLTELRIEDAKTLLANTKLSVTEIENI